MQSVPQKSLVILPGFVDKPDSQQTVGSVEARMGCRDAKKSSFPCPECLLLVRPLAALSMGRLPLLRALHPRRTNLGQASLGRGEPFLH